MRVLVLVAAVIAALRCLAPGPSLAATNVLFILDSSGSMWAKVDGAPKVVTAKRVLNDTLHQLPPGTKIGLMTYGHRRKGDCSDIEVLSAIGADGPDAISAKVNALQPKGETPIATALEQSIAVFKNFQGDHNVVILITDGAEECHGDPCAAVRKLAAAGLDVQVNVVGFNLAKKEREGVECIAREGHGKYYDAKDQKSLSAAMVQVRQQVAQAPPAPAPAPTPPPAPKETNLLAPSEGGQLLAAPSDAWQAVVSGNDSQYARVSEGQEAVWGFKDDRPATFAKFTLLINGTSAENIKDFELFAGDESPTGTFRSLGKFTAQNIKLLKTPNQEFTFPETTAKYFKVKILSHYGDLYWTLTQIRLIGKLGDAPAATAATAQPAAPALVNLLAADQGGQLLAAPSDAWQAVVSGTEGQYARVGEGQEAVFGFKDERPATFSKFTMLINSSSYENIKDFELFAGDESPTGTFRSLGKFAAQNVKLLKTPYQEFTFPETTAKYFKIKILSHYGDLYWTLTQIRLLGKLAGGPAVSTAATPAQPAAPALVNLLAADQGGELLAAPSDAWQAVVSGTEGQYARVGQGQEAIFGFKGEKPATFSKFTILINAMSYENIKDFELFAGDESPAGAFRSLGKFTTQNVKLLKTPYQEFAFPETTAKYFKIKILSNYGDLYWTLTQIRLMGKPGT
jgi:hypothetical protein